MYYFGMLFEAGIMALLVDLMQLALQGYFLLMLDGVHT
jgi:hypothetical protein